MAQKVLELTDCERYCAPLVNEGGAIHVDGQGTALVTEQCLLNPNRNPALERAEIEALLRGYLGASCVIWLGEGVVDDETSGHIDNLACFVRPGEVCLTWMRRSARSAASGFARRPGAPDRRRAMRAAGGCGCTSLPIPGPLYMTRREARGIAVALGHPPAAGRAAARGELCEFLPCQWRHDHPAARCAYRRRARRGLRRMFPRRRIVGVPAREILLGGGSIHCITQQQPAPDRARRRPAAFDSGQRRPARARRVHSHSRCMRR